MVLADEIQDICGLNFALSNDFLVRLSEGNLTRDENPITHFSLYFLPYNPHTNKVFIVHHKKSGLWLSPGGHIDKGETLFQTLERELLEELGFSYKTPRELKPFFLSIVPINNVKHSCRVHYDIWYKIETDGCSFHVDPREFYDAKWLTIPEARPLITDSSNLEALAKVELLFQEM